MMEEYTEEEFCPAALRERSLVLELTDDRNALERAMLHFSDLEKETVKIDRKHYRITIWYKKDDETEILIRILSFGPVLKVLEPAALVDQIVQRLDRQLLYGNLVDCTWKHIDSEERIQSAQLFFKDKFQNVWYKL